MNTGAMPSTGGVPSLPPMPEVGPGFELPTPGPHHAVICELIHIPEDNAKNFYGREMVCVVTQLDEPEPETGEPKKQLLFANLTWGGRTNASKLRKILAAVRGVNALSLDDVQPVDWNEFMGTTIKLVTIHEPKQNEPTQMKSKVIQITKADPGVRMEPQGYSSIASAILGEAQQQGSFQPAQASRQAARPAAQQQRSFFGGGADDEDDDVPF